jgi:hypothetical protein
LNLLTRQGEKTSAEEKDYDSGFGRVHEEALSDVGMRFAVESTEVQISVGTFREGKSPEKPSVCKYNRDNTTIRRRP